MKIKHHEIEIPEQNPFKYCKLEREQYAVILTNIIEIYADGFVLSINNEWGAGKTTFVKMWQQYLKNKNFETIYFNAWENDFDNNPLVAIISELKTLAVGRDKVIFKSIIEKGAVITKSVLPALVKVLAKKYINIEELVDAIENTTKGATEILEGEIKQYAKKKQTILEFRKELELYINKTGSNRPLVFIVDELDRCRPDYAVEVLEQLKHFFSVPGIVFVLSIDKSHLAASVRGYYGSEQINTEEYLRKFIDLEYAIPAPTSITYCKYLYHYYSFDDFFLSEERKKYREFDKEYEQFLNIAAALFTHANATLRQQEKIFAQYRLVLRQFQGRDYTFSYLLFFLLFVRMLNIGLYRKIEAYAYSLQELSDVFSDAVPKRVQNTYGVNFIRIQALLIFFYNNALGDKKERLLSGGIGGMEISNIKSKLHTSGITLTGCFIDYQNTWPYNDFTLEYLLKKINLMESIF